APRGVIGLETAVPAVLALDTGPEILFERMSSAPARLVGLERHGRPLAPGSPSEVVVVDPGERWTASGFRSKSQNSPWKGSELVGRAIATVHRGALVHSIERVGAG
ncbi:MAG: dihydroorotase, partial [Acidimicrobiia bacterium]|nr:dihydroorotase [Acidimicrobiia bacterium]